MLVACLVPLAAIAPGREQIDEIAVEPGLPAAGAADVVDPAAGHHPPAARHPAIAHHRQKARDPRCDMGDSAGGSRCPQAVDGDLGIARPSGCQIRSERSAGQGCLAARSRIQPRRSELGDRQRGQALAMRTGSRLSSVKKLLRSAGTGDGFHPILPAVEGEGAGLVGQSSPRNRGSPLCRARRRWRHRHRPSRRPGHRR